MEAPICLFAITFACGIYSRKQNTAIIKAVNYLSNWKTVPCGVSQGSELGPALFTICVKQAIKY